MELIEEQQGGCTLLTLNHPPLNTLNHEAVIAIGDWFKAYDRDQPLVISGAGKAFSAGVDTKAFLSYSEVQRKDFFNAITRMTAHLCAINVPVIAAINGHAMGGGFVMPLCADYRIAADGDGKFGLTEAQAGVPFPAGPVEIIKHELPPTLLRHLTLSSRVVDASFLHEHLVFDELVAAETVVAQALDRARALAAQPAFRAVKVQVRQGLADRLRELNTVD